VLVLWSKIWSNVYWTLHRNGNQTEHVDCLPSSTYEKLLPFFRTTER
jgi:hypothetical protein